MENDRIVPPNRDTDHAGLAAASPATVTARQEIAATRQRMSDTIAEIESRVSGTVQRVKQRADVVGLVRENPLTALAAAFVAGLALAATGSDRRVMTATTHAVKRAPDTAKRGATKTAVAVSALVSRAAGAAASRLTGSDTASGVERPGLYERLTSKVSRELGDELRNGVNELPRAGASIYDMQSFPE